MPINRQSIVSSPAQYISQFITVAYYLSGLYNTYNYKGRFFAKLWYSKPQEPDPEYLLKFTNLCFILEIGT
jgi:hypothetical protein